ncbi:hypothetical protein PHMEG_00011194 [Phytophthora megakarya]|uniref:Uncharacterized protein n=1 Tax=Phytophthora megakarya TaxID=4795 RepID=A0A225WCS2_9STRA|nr:hypothetical protein PHMEG_00011194 [Phytophthora megakarya]
MPTNAELQAEIERLNQAKAARTRVPSNLPKFAGKKGEGVREWLFQRLSFKRTTTGNRRVSNGQSSLGVIPALVFDDEKRGAHHVLQHFEASNYQAVLREKLQHLCGGAGSAKSVKMLDPACHCAQDTDYRRGYSY